MDSTHHFEYIIKSCICGFNPSSADLTCGEVIQSRIILETNSTSFSLPEQTIGLQTGPIPLYIPNKTAETSSTSSFSLNCPGISKLLTSRFGQANYSDIMSEIEDDIMSSTSKGIGVFQVKILKVITKVSKIDKASEKLLTDLYDTDSTIDCRRYNTSSGCVICLEAYKGGSVIAKLPCGHDFHGVCINTWSKIKYQCPLCRSQLSRSEPFSLYLCFSLRGK